MANGERFSKRRLVKRSGMPDRSCVRLPLVDASGALFLRTRDAVVADVDREHGGLVVQQRLDPDAAVVEVVAGDGIFATEEGPLDAAGPSVIDADLALAHDIPTGMPRHGVSPRCSGGTP